MLMKTLAQELAIHKIRVNAISSDAIKTPINPEARDTQKKVEALLKLIPYRRVGKPSDIPKAAVEVNTMPVAMRTADFLPTDRNQPLNSLQENEHD